MKILIAVMCATVGFAACAGAPPAPVASTASIAPKVNASPTASPTTSNSATGAAVAEVDVCRLMTLADVQASSPFQTPLAVVETPLPGDPVSGCKYTAAIGSKDPVSVILNVSDPRPSAEYAKTALANFRQEIIDRGQTVTDIAGLGDVAFASGEDEVGVHAIVGSRQIDANFKGEWPDLADDAKVAAGTALIRTIISRLP